MAHIDKKHTLLGILCLMTGVVLFSCSVLFSCKSSEEDVKDETTKPYLSLAQYGENRLSIAGGDEVSFKLTVKLHGGNSNSEFSATLNAWNETELASYNEKNGTSFKLLPAEYYTISTPSIIVKAAEKQADVVITIKAAQVTPNVEKGIHYVLPLHLNSDEADLRYGQCDVILRLAIDYANLDFVIPNVVEKVNVNDVLVTTKVKTTLDYKVDGKDMASSWDFTCDLKVPENAAALLDAYNKQNNTDYELLPEGSFSSGQVSYAVGDREAEATITIHRSKIEVKYYLLPLVLANPSNNQVTCTDNVYYIVAGRFYTNPIISDRGIGDPTVIKAQDGLFYLYATQNSKDYMPIYSSEDLVNWTYRKNAFQNATKPAWNPDNAFWAPDMQYINGKYVLYYSYAKMNGTSQSHTCVVTADTPLGTITSEYPKGAFLNSKKLLSNEEFGGNCIDQFFYEDNGHKYLFYGSFSGIYVVELTDDGLDVKRDAEGNPVLKQQVCGLAFEGTNIYKKGDYYYLFASVGWCCAGENSNYSVVVGRSKSLFGPYVDKEGKKMLNNGYSLVVNGGDKSKWVGPGHNSVIIKDDAGTEWMIYHSFCYKEKGDRSSFGGRYGMLDRLQWTDDGWPYIKNYVPSELDLIPVFHK